MKVASVRFRDKGEANKGDEGKPQLPYHKLVGEENFPINIFLKVGVQRL
jgi:hypothetical protein